MEIQVTGGGTVSGDATGAYRCEYENHHADPVACDADGAKGNVDGGKLIIEANNMELGIVSTHAARS